MEKKWLSNIIRPSQSPEDKIRPYTMRTVGRTENLNVKQRISDIEKEGYEIGFSKGEEKGLELGKRKLEGVINDLSSILNEMKDLRRKAYEENEEELIKITIAIAKKIINSELKINRDVISNVIKNALTKCTDRNNIKIRVNPLDIETLNKYLPNSIQSIDGMKNISFEEDRSIGQGGCIIETGQGDIDARIEKQIMEIENGLATYLNSRNKE